MSLTTLSAKGIQPPPPPFFVAMSQQPTDHESEASLDENESESESVNAGSEEEEEEEEEVSMPTTLVEGANVLMLHAPEPNSCPACKTSHARPRACKPLNTCDFAINAASAASCLSVDASGSRLATADGTPYDVDLKPIEGEPPLSAGDAVVLEGGDDDHRECLARVVATTRNHIYVVVVGVDEHPSDQAASEAKLALITAAAGYLLYDVPRITINMGGVTTYVHVQSVDGSTPFVEGPLTIEPYARREELRAEGGHTIVYAASAAEAKDCLARGFRVLYGGDGDGASLRGPGGPAVMRVANAAGRAAMQAGLPAKADMCMFSGTDAADGVLFASETIRAESIAAANHLSTLLCPFFDAIQVRDDGDRSIRAACTACPFPRCMLCVDGKCQWCGGSKRARKRVKRKARVLPCPGYVVEAAGPDPNMVTVLRRAMATVSGGSSVVCLAGFATPIESRPKQSFRAMLSTVLVNTPGLFVYFVVAGEPGEPDDIVAVFRRFTAPALPIAPTIDGFVNFNGRPVHVYLSHEPPNEGQHPKSYIDGVDGYLRVDSASSACAVIDRLGIDTARIVIAGPAGQVAAAKGAVKGTLIVDASGMCERSLVRPDGTPVALTIASEPCVPHATTYTFNGFDPAGLAIPLLHSALAIVRQQRDPDTSMDFLHTRDVIAVLTTGRIKNVYAVLRSGTPIPPDALVVTTTFLGLAALTVDVMAVPPTGVELPHTAVWVGPGPTTTSIIDTCGVGKHAVDMSLAVQWDQPAAVGTYNLCPIVAIEVVPDRVGLILQFGEPLPPNLVGGTYRLVRVVLAVDIPTVRTMLATRPGAPGARMVQTVAVSAVAAADVNRSHMAICAADAAPADCRPTTTPAVAARMQLVEMASRPNQHKPPISDSQARQLVNLVPTVDAARLSDQGVGYGRTVTGKLNGPLSANVTFGPLFVTKTQTKLASVLTTAVPSGTVSFTSTVGATPIVHGMAVPTPVPRAAEQALLVASAPVAPLVIGRVACQPADFAAATMWSINTKSSLPMPVGMQVRVRQTNSGPPRSGAAEVIVPPHAETKVATVRFASDGETGCVRSVDMAPMWLCRQADAIVAGNELVAARLATLQRAAATRVTAPHASALPVASGLLQLVMNTHLGPVPDAPPVSLRNASLYDRLYPVASQATTLWRVRIAGLERLMTLWNAGRICSVPVATDADVISNVIAMLQAAVQDVTSIATWTNQCIAAATDAAAAAGVSAARVGAVKAQMDSVVECVESLLQFDLPPASTCVLCRVSPGDSACTLHTLAEEILASKYQLGEIVARDQALTKDDLVTVAAAKSRVKRLISELVAYLRAADKSAAEVAKVAAVDHSTDSLVAVAIAATDESTAAESIAVATRTRRSKRTADATDVEPASAAKRRK
jgi:hypothetical protein